MATGLSGDRQIAALREVVDDAIAVRDARRKWAGPSGEAVASACQALLMRNDPLSVLTHGLPAPGGDATEEEASEPTVLRYAALV